MKFFFLLRHNGLTVFSKDQTKELHFPTEVIRHQEIIDQKAFEKLLNTVFSYFSNQDTVLFLSDELVFLKSVPQSQDTVIKEEEKQFTDTVPFASNHSERKTIHTKSALLLLAANSDLYKTITTIGQHYKCHIKRVIPLSLFAPLFGGQQVSYDLFAKILKEKELVKEADLLLTTKEPTIKKPLPLKQIGLLSLSLLCLLAAVWWASTTLGLLPAQKTTKQTTTLPTPTTQVTSASPEVSPEIEKSAIKIQVLNGSGVAGQASKIKDQLTAIDFTNIQIGNTEGPTSNATIVVFSNRVPKEYKDAILAELKKSFAAIDTQNVPTADPFDAAITIGEIK